MELTKKSRAYYEAAGVMAMMNFWENRKNALQEYDRDPAALIAKVRQFSDSPVEAAAIAEVFEVVRGYESPSGTLMTLAAAAEKYGCNRDYLRVAANRRTLPANKVGRDWMVTDDLMAAFVSRNANRDSE